MKDSDTTIIDAIKNIKVSSIRKLAWMLWRIIVLSVFVFSLIFAVYYPFGNNSIFIYWDGHIYERDILNVFGWLLSISISLITMKELKSGCISAFMIKFLTTNPNIKQP